MSMRPPPPRVTHLPRHGPSKSVSQLPSSLHTPTTRSIASPFGHTRQGSVTQSPALTQLATTAPVAACPAPAPWRPSLSSLLLTNLRLLDLDTSQDWPNLTPRSFTTQDQKARIRAVEWTLYHLFSIFDPDETRDKLQPFFPPLEPLQSLNLRAALYRCLSELKKNGVLGREVVLRKTMLDECKGEKLLEALVLFSTVLIKRGLKDVKERASKTFVKSSTQEKMVALERKHASIGKNIASSTSLTAKERRSLIPLSLAHRASLARSLEKKNEKRVRYATFAEIMVQKSAELEQRHEMTAQCTAPELSSGEELMLLKQIQANWPGGNNAWSEALLRGDIENAGDEILKRDFGEIWHVMVEGGDLQPRHGAGIGLLVELEQRVEAQKARLRRWQAYGQRLAGYAGSGMNNRGSQDSARFRVLPTFRFDRHQHLHLSDAGSRDDRHASRPLTEANDYKDILARMAMDLEKEAQKTNRSDRMAMIDLSDSNLRGSTNNQIGKPPPSLVRTSSDSSRARAEPFPTRSFQPLRKFSPSSLFSPLKSQPGQQEDASDTADLSLSDVLENMKTSDSKGPEPEMKRSDSLVQDRKQTALSSAEYNQRKNQSSAEDANKVLTAGQPGLLAIAQPTVNAIQNQPAPTLSERTRMSLAHSDALLGRQPNPQAATAKPSEVANIALPAGDSQPPTEEITQEQRRQTLAERTRQSMAFAFQVNEQIDDNAPLRPRKVRESLLPKKPRHSLAQHPVNQFETPKRAGTAALTQLAEEEGGSFEEDHSGAMDGDQSPDGEANPNLLHAARQIKRIATPTEVLFSPDANVDSVFRSRPKMRMSPVLRPLDGGMLNGGDEGEDGGGVGQSSPSRRRAW